MGLCRSHVTLIGQVACPLHCRRLEPIQMFVDVPADIRELEKSERFTLLETLADHDDALLEQLLSDLDPPREQIFKDLTSDIAAGHVIPVLFGSAEHGNGIGRLMKSLRHDVTGLAETLHRQNMKMQGGSIVHVIKTQHTMQGGKLSLARVMQGEVVDGMVLHDAEGREARIAGLGCLQGVTNKKIASAGEGQLVVIGRLEHVLTGTTLASAKAACQQLVSAVRQPGVYGLAVAVADRKDEVKLTSAIHKLIEEDPSLSFSHDHDTGDMVLWGQGEMHLRVALERLASKFGVHATTRLRRIAYKETIRKSLSLRGRHRKQSGGHGQFGDVVVDIAPLPRGSGFVFSDTISGGVVPKQYIFLQLKTVCANG